MCCGRALSQPLLMPECDKAHRRAWSQTEELLTSCLKSASSRTAWRSTWVKLCITETDISFKKVRARHSSPGNGTNTSKDATKCDTKIRTELCRIQEQQLDSWRPKPPNLNGKVACVQLLSEKSLHNILLRHSRSLRSKREGNEDPLVKLHLLRSYLSVCKVTYLLHCIPSSSLGSRSTWIAMNSQKGSIKLEVPK